MTYTVSIAGVSPDPEVYVGLVKATTYIGARRARPAAKKWLAMTEDDQESTLVEATSYVDVREWEGAPTGEGGTTLAFPRSGTGLDDSSAEQLARVEQAVCELAMLIAVDPSIIDALDQGSNIKKMDADGALIEFFAPTSVADGTATTLPPIVQRLLGRYTAASATGITIAGGSSYGTDGESAFDDCDAIDRSDPF